MTDKETLPLKAARKLNMLILHNEAFSDRIHDRTINQIGRQRAKTGLYRDSKEACYPYRVDGINEKY